MKNRTMIGGKLDQQWKYISRYDSVYFHVDHFIKDFRSGAMKPNFILDEGVFMELASRMSVDKNFAKEIADNSVVLLLAANEGADIDGLIELAMQVASEGKNG